MRIVIVGAGEVGYQIARRLASEAKDVVVIDKSEEALRRFADLLDVQTVCGSGANPRVLDEAGLAAAEIILAVTDSDETNLIACLFAQALAPHLSKIVRVRNTDYLRYLETTNRLLGVDRIINPEAETVKTIMRLIDLPGAVESSEFAGGRILFLGLRLPHDCPLAGLRLADLRAVAGPRFIIGAIVRDNRLIIPSGGDRLEARDLVYVVCDTVDGRALIERFGCPAPPMRSICVIGGGNVGAGLARELEERNYQVKLIERDSARCAKLSGDLDRTVVLNGDATDQGLLEEENVGRMDLVVALTQDDETNILSCLLAKSLGVGRTIARVNKFNYVPVVQAVGVEHTVSTRLSAVNSILQSIRRGKVLSAVSIKGEEAEAMEAVALAHSGVVGKPLRDLAFPRGAIVLCVMRADDVIIPTGDFAIEPQDRIIILATRKAIPKVEQVLSVTLEYF